MEEDDQEEMLEREHTKRCGRCGEVKSVDDFGYSKRTSDKCQTRCKKCDSEVHKEWADNNRALQRKRARRSNFKQRHGIIGLDDWFEDQLRKQNNMCAMSDCNKTLSDNGKSLAVDHNHRTKKLRALLCVECNLALDWYEKTKFRAKIFECYLEEYDG